MRSFYRFPLVLSVFLLSCSSSQAEHSKSLRARHRRAEKLNNTFDVNNKRDDNVAFTYFVDGQGACGGPIDGPSDFIVALNSAEYDGGAHCFKMVTITINGKTAVAQIKDECPGCQPGGLDFSQGLFEYFAPLSSGALHGTWSYISDVPTSSLVPAPSTSYTPSSTPATTMATTPTSSSSTITSSASTPTSSVITVPISTPQDPQMLAQIDLVLLELGVLLQASLRLEN